MIRLCKYNQENIIEKIRNGQLDALALSTTNLIDDIILEMNSRNIFNCLEKYIPDFRADNTVIPYGLIWASAIAAKCVSTQVLLISPMPLMTIGHWLN